MGCPCAARPNGNTTRTKETGPEVPQALQVRARGLTRPIRSGGTPVLRRSGLRGSAARSGSCLGLILLASCGTFNLSCLTASRATAGWYAGLSRTVGFGFLNGSSSPVRLLP